MDIGMLWFDNDKQVDLRSKIERAAAYYRDKYGKAPNLCFVHPCMIPANPGESISSAVSQSAEKSQIQEQGVEIRTSNTMLPNHFWIGINRRESTSAL
ncbi:MAG TPA: hypothetical protein DEH25_01840 [Chloroflexi bacterium]|nr:hypothetical protein [Chloroflexota bacterium]HBY08290.1 hypothetical protein [Chloroflexota bacterium]